MRKQFWVLLICVWNSLQMLAGVGFDYYFEQITIADGLSQNYVTCIAQDSLGFIWSGSPNGLNRYDGYRVKEYSLDNVSAIFCDSYGKLWVGTHRGLYRYLPHTDSFEFVRLSEIPDDYPENTHLLSFCEDRERTLWLGTAGGMLYAFRPEEQRVERTFVSAGHAPIRSLTLYRDSLLVGCGNGQGTMRLDKESGQLFRAAADSLYLHVSVTSLLPEADGKELWVGTYNHGLLRYGKLEPQLDTPHIQGLCRFPDGSLLIATENNGLLEYDVRSRKTVPVNTTRKEVNLNSDGITCLYIDTHGMVWVGTTNGGINKFDSHQAHFRYISLHTDGLSWQSIHSVFTMSELNEENLLVGLDNKGLYVYNRSTGKILPYEYERVFPGLKDTPVNAVLRDSRGFVWIGTYNKSMKVAGPLPEQAEINRLIAGALMPSTSVKYIYEDTSHRVWAGTSNGEVICYRPDDRTLQKYDTAFNTQLHPNVILSIYEDSDKRIWIGSICGLYVWEEEQQDFRLAYLPVADNLFGGENTIIPICQSGDALWLGSQAGLVKYSPESGQTKRFTTADGLPSNKIKGLLPDRRNGCLWISTDKGLCCLDPDSCSFTGFGLEDGIINREFNNMSCLCDRNGEFFFGSINGIYHFRPEQIKADQKAPRVIITGCQLYDNTLKEQEGRQHIIPVELEKNEVRIPYSESMFSIHYVGLNYTNTRKNEYAYKLENYDGDWKYVGRQRVATYTHLEPGTYLFRVIASNSNGVWNKEGCTLRIIILPPWYRTGWAYTVYMIVVVLLFYFFLALYTNRIRMKSQLEKEQFERKQLENLNQLKMQFFSNITHEFRTPLTLILSPLDNIIHHRVGRVQQDDYLQMIRNNAIRLLKLVNELLDFSKSEAGYFSFVPVPSDLARVIRKEFQTFVPLAEGKHISLSYVCEEETLCCMADNVLIQKMVSNLLSNAVKYTPEGGTIRVGLRRTNNPLPSVELFVEDSGKGIPQEQQQRIFERFYQMEEDSSNGTGIGLALVKKLVDIHRGIIEVESKVNEGSRFVVRIPYEEAPPCIEEPESEEELTTEQTADTQAVSLTDRLEEEPLSVSKPYTVLVVEDNEELCTYISSLLSVHYNILLASNGREAWEMAREELPQLILSDLLMPEMDGKELCRLIKQNIHTCHIPFIMLTALISENSQKEALDVGADDYLTKPFSSEILLSKIANMLQSRALLSRQVRALHAMQSTEVVSSDRDGQFLLRLVEIVKENMSNSDLKIDDLSKELGMSHTPFYKKIKQLTNQTPNDFLKGIRLEQARKLLMDSELTISEIAYQTGFSTPKYFRECFKKQYGETPSDYLEKRNENGSVR